MSSPELKIDEEGERKVFEESLASATQTPAWVVRGTRNGDEYKDMVITGIWQGWRWRAALAALSERNVAVKFSADMSTVRAEVDKMVADLEAEITALKAAPAVPDEWTGIWQHSSGNKYRVLMLTNADASDSRYPLTVVYQGEDGQVWSRRADDWHRSMTLLQLATAEPFRTSAKDSGV